jgi:hypothetical protein
MPKFIQNRHSIYKIHNRRLVAQLLKDLWINETDPELNNLMTVDPKELEELQGIFKSLKNTKSSGSDGMIIEILKYMPVEIKIKIFKHN